MDLIVCNSEESNVVFYQSAVTICSDLACLYWQTNGADALSKDIRE